MSNHEQIAQIAQDKWATVSDSLRLRMINVWMSDLRKKIWLKKSKILFFCMFYIVFLLKKWAIGSFSLFWWAMWSNRSGRSPKMSEVSKSLRSLTKNEQPWAIRSGYSEEMSDHERIAQVAHQKLANERISCFFEGITHSLTVFLGKKRAICSENRWVNSQPCVKWTIMLKRQCDN